MQSVGYAYSGKTTCERGPGHCLKDYRYYRCAGSDGYRFGGERICSNGQIQAGFLEAAVWREVCDLLKNPEKLEQEFKEGGEADASLQNAEALKAMRLKQQHALERLIDSFTEGLIEKDQFTSRMARTKVASQSLMPRYRLTPATSINWSTCGSRRSSSENSRQPSDRTSWMPIGIAGEN